MGRREQRERERKRAASTCQTLDRFLPVAKRVSARKDPETSGHRDDASLIELEPPGISSPAHPGQPEVGQEEPITKNCDERADQDVSLPVPQCPTVGRPERTFRSKFWSRCSWVCRRCLFVRDCEAEQEVAQRLQELPQEKNTLCWRSTEVLHKDFSFQQLLLEYATGVSDLRGWAMTAGSPTALSWMAPFAFLVCSGVKGWLQLGKLVTRPFRAWQKNVREVRWTSVDKVPSGVHGTSGLPQAEDWAPTRSVAGAAGSD